MQPVSIANACDLLSSQRHAACCPCVARRYGVLVLVVELLGLSAVLPYGFLLPFYTASSGSRGLPIDDGRVVLPREKCFVVHILVPCYKVRRREARVARIALH